MAAPSVSLRDLAPQKFHTLSKVKPMGAIQARLQISGSVMLYWRYSIGKASERVQIGLWDATAPPKRLEPTALGYSLAAATRHAEGLAIEHHSHRAQGGRPALKKAEEQAQMERAAEHALAATATLTHLLDEYCLELKRLGKDAHRNARSTFKVHVFEAFPALASKPAATITDEDIATLMRKPHLEGKQRTSNKLRSYLHAAFELAITSRTQASVPARFKEFGIKVNPVAATKPDRSANRADKDPLSTDELRAYWKLIKDMPGERAAWLRLHLLSGGQRIEQLVRLQTKDIHEKQGYFVLYDIKGRPGAGPRAHWVPLTPPVAKALADCKPQGEYAISTTKGEKAAAGTTLSNFAIEVAEPHIPGFKTKRIRSGVETALASQKVSLEARGHLQSHGISGVQARHYDGHDYLDEKRDALQRLHALITGKAPLRKK